MTSVAMTDQKQAVMTMLEHVDDESGMTNVLLEQLTKESCSLLQGNAKFLGVFNADKLPRPASAASHCTFIVNLASPSQGQYRGHFISMYVNPADRYIVYVDSLGLPCMLPQLHSLIQALKLPFFYNVKTLQNMSSKACGLYSLLMCMFFTIHTQHGITLPKFQFSSQAPLSNDLKCHKYILLLLNLTK